MNIEALITPARLEKDVQHLKDWLLKEPHMPKIEDEKWLITQLHHNKYSLEKTKMKLDNYFSFRNKYPEILKNRDPLGEDIAQARVAYNLSLSDQLTKDGERIFYTKFQPDVSLFNITNHLKYGFMITELFYLEDDRHQNLLCITDCQHLSYGHFLKGLPGIKTGVDIFFTAYSDRLKAFHIINCPPGLEYVLNAFKGFFPAKIAERFFIHSTPKGLTQDVDEDVLSCDFGGKGPTLAELDEHTAELLKKHRKWFLEQENVATNEELRRKEEKQAENLKGSFRQLDFD